MALPELTIRLPGWVGGFLGDGAWLFSTPEDRMRLVVELARQNIERHTGGPFAAGVFDERGVLVAPGVNLVVWSGCSVLHAEVVALALAQKQLGRYDIGDGGRSRYELVTSTEPCAMCLGAIPWSGVSRIVCGARDEDARRIGFDEGSKLPEWDRALEARGIEVVRDVLRGDAVSVLERYVQGGGPIYNAGMQRG